MRGPGGLENATDCYDAGYKDGRDSPFVGGANDICRQFTDDQGNPYYSGFIYGCMSVQNNTMDDCETAQRTKYMESLLLSITVGCGEGYNSEEIRLKRVFVSLFTSSQRLPKGAAA